jgi:hypothetical protein
MNCRCDNCKAIGRALEIVYFAMLKTETANAHLSLENAFDWLESQTPNKW